MKGGREGGNGGRERVEGGMRERGEEGEDGEEGKERGKEVGGKVNSDGLFAQ